MGKEIYLGFIHVNKLEKQVGKQIVSSRIAKGEFTDLDDFVSRIRIGIQQLILLIRIDTFRFTGKNKSTLLWDAHLLLGKKTPHEPQESLFKLPRKKFTLPELHKSQLEDAYDEIEILGFPVSCSYFDLLQTNYRGKIKAKELINHVGRKIRIVGHLVVIKYVRTVKREWMHFATFLDDTGDFFDTTHFPQSLKHYPFKGYGVYLILGKVVQEFGFPSIEVEKMAKLSIKSPEDQEQLPARRNKKPGSYFTKGTAMLGQ